MAKNASHIRQLGYTALVLGFVGPGVEYLAATEILNRLPPTIPVLNPGSTFNIWTVMVALFILPLPHIWSYGLEI